jgi:hypothetical protein
VKSIRSIPVLAAFGTLVLAGCAMNASRDVGHYVVSTPQTPIFRYGPAQSFGPDFNLQQGQHVVMLRREFGYSRIMTDDGQSGYVATEDLAPAPPPAKAPNKHETLPRLASRGTSRPGVSSANNRVLEAGPLFEAGGLPPLPDRESETPDPPRKGEPKKSDGHKPEFRYPKPKPGFRVNVPKPDEDRKP